MVDILITDDHPIFAKGLEIILRTSNPSARTYHADHIDPAKDQLKRHPEIALMLLDRTLPGVDSLGYIKEFTALQPNLRIAIISAHESCQHVHDALEAGAAGFIPKSLPVDATIKAIDLLLNGNIYIPKYLLEHAYRKRTTPDDLTIRQLEIISLAALGQSNKRIAFNLNLTEGTVKQHFNAILRILIADNRAHAIRIARLRGLIS
jgi:DNA-binding NarL/FixJ family response regulator